MPPTKTACFFSHEPRANFQRAQYLIQDMRILRDLGFRTTVATSFHEVPWNCDLYFSWWASGSILPLVKARLSRKSIIVVAGGHESMLVRDSVTGRPYGYLATAWYKKLATRLSLRFATVVLVVSHHMVGDAGRLGARAPIVVPNSIDCDIFRPSDRTRSLVTTVFSVNDDSVVIKRGEIFIRAVPLILTAHPDQVFAIIGEKGNAYERLRALAISLRVQDSIEFVGTMDNADVAGWLQRSKVYVQISDTETFGVAIAEAMSTGTPVVVGRNGAVEELVGDCGLFVDHNNPRSVAAGISSLLDLTQDERDRRGLDARARIIDWFSYDRRKAAIARVIDSLP